MNSIARLGIGLVKAAIEFVIEYIVIVYLLYEKLHWIDQTDVKMLMVIVIAGCLIEVFGEIISSEENGKHRLTLMVIGVFLFFVVLYIGLNQFMTAKEMGYFVIKFVFGLVGIAILAYLSLTLYLSKWSGSAEGKKDVFEIMGITHADLPKWKTNRTHHTDEWTVYVIHVEPSSAPSTDQIKRVFATCVERYLPTANQNLLIKIVHENDLWVGGYIRPMSVSLPDAAEIKEWPIYEQDLPALFWEQDVIPNVDLGQ